VTYNKTKSKPQNGSPQFHLFLNLKCLPLNLSLSLSLYIYIYRLYYEISQSDRMIRFKPEFNLIRRPRCDDYMAIKRLIYQKQC
jgi:hypothetical protein